jgi:hypothetical protein
MTTFFGFVVSKSVRGRTRAKPASAARSEKASGTLAALPQSEIWRKYLALAAFVLPVSPAIGYLLGGMGVAIASEISAVVIMALIELRLRRLATPPD